MANGKTNGKPRAEGNGKSDIDRLSSDLLPLFANAAVGDFSSTIEIPDEGPFIDIYAGVLMLLDVVRQKIHELEDVNVGLEKNVGERTKQLSQSVDELTKLNKFLVNRELRMRELKKEIEALRQQIAAAESRVRTG